MFTAKQSNGVLDMFRGCGACFGYHQCPVNVPLQKRYGVTQREDRWRIDYNPVELGCELLKQRDWRRSWVATVRSDFLRF